MIGLFPAVRSARSTTAHRTEKATLRSTRATARRTRAARDGGAAWRCCLYSCPACGCTRRSSCATGAAWGAERAAAVTPSDRGARTASTTSTFYDIRFLRVNPHPTRSPCLTPLVNPRRREYLTVLCSPSSESVADQFIFVQACRTRNRPPR